MENKKPYSDKDKSEDYLGNIWGWKISYIGLAVILFLLALMAYRHYQVGDWRPTQNDEIIPTIETPYHQ